MTRTILSPISDLLRRHLVAIDVVVAVGVLSGFAIDEWGAHGAWVGIVTMCLVPLGLAIRRPRMVAALALVSLDAGARALWSVDDVGQVVVAAAVIYTAATHVRISRLAFGAAFAIVVVPLLGAVIRGEVTAGVETAFSDLVVTAVALMAGLAARDRRAARRALTLRAEQVELNKRRDDEILLAEERTRLAHEVHDTLTHALTAIVLQAQGAQGLTTTRPDDVEAALDSIAFAGRASMNDLRLALRLLAGPDVASRSLAAIDDLRVANADIDIDVQWSGNDRHVKPALAATVYRIVQESITNARRHGGADVIVVEMDCSSPVMRVCITDNGRGDKMEQALVGSGNGIAAMRDRAEACGGRLEIAATVSGWQVVAELPNTAHGAPR